MGDAFWVVNNNRRTAAQLMQRGHTLGRLQRFHQLAYHPYSDYAASTYDAAGNGDQPLLLMQWSYRYR
jgi:hypothetical protein